MPTILKGLRRFSVYLRRIRPNYLSIAEASARSGLTSRALINLCRHGYLQGAKQAGSNWHIPAFSLETWLRKAQQSSFRISPAPGQKASNRARAPEQWQKIIDQPIVFWFLRILGVVTAIIVFLFAAISAGADFGPFQDQLYQWGWARPFPPRQDGETLIVIANFYTGEISRQSTIHEELQTAIQEQMALLGLSNIRVEIDPTVLRASEEAKAEEIGQFHEATIIIWGSDTNFRVETSFLDITRPSFEILTTATLSPENQRTILAAPDAYVQFVTEELSPQITFLALYAIGSASFNNQNNVIAEAVIRHALSNFANKMEPQFHPSLSNIYLRLALINQDADKFDQAISDYSQSLAYDPNNWSAYQNRGLAYAFQENFGKAVTDFNQAIAINPHYQDSYLFRGNAYSGLGNYDQAIVDLTQAIFRDPNDWSAYHGRAIAYAAIGEPDKAFADYNQLVVLEPEFSRSYLYRAHHYITVANYSEAIQDYSRAILLDPNPASIYHLRGGAYMVLQQFAEALADFNQAIQLDPTNAGVYLSRGNLFITLGELDKAIADYTRMLLLDPNRAGIHHLRGGAYMALQQFDEALADFNQELQLAPNNIGAYLSRGNLFITLGEFDKAVADFTELLVLDPVNLSALSSRGNAYHTQGRFDEALADYTQLLSLTPDNVGIYISRGNVYFAQGQLNEALADFDQALLLDPQNIGAYYSRGSAYYLLDRIDEAFADFAQVIQLDSKTGTLIESRIQEL